MLHGGGVCLDRDWEAANESAKQQQPARGRRRRRSGAHLARIYVLCVFSLFARDGREPIRTGRRRSQRDLLARLGRRDGRSGKTDDTLRRGVRLGVPVGLGATGEADELLCFEEAVERGRAEVEAADFVCYVGVGV